MHASDPEPSRGVDGAVIEPHAGAIIHQGERAQGLSRKIVGCNLAPGGNDEIASAPNPQRRYGGFRSVSFQFLRRRVPAMDVLVLDEVHPVQSLFRRIPARTFTDHIAHFDHIFRLHRCLILFCWYALEPKGSSADRRAVRSLAPDGWE